MHGPISLEILAQIGTVWEEVCSDQFEVSLFKAATPIAFFGALRISELVVAGKSNRSLSSLERKDVVISDRQVVITLRRSKTSQMG